MNNQTMITKQLNLSKTLASLMTADGEIEIDHVTLLDYLASAGILLTDDSADGVNYASLAYMQELVSN